MFDSSKFIRDYLFKKFDGKYKLSSNGQELITNSPFIEDNRFKFTINVESGLWRDFAEHTQGNFIQLYSKLEGVSYKKAEEAMMIGSIRNEEKSTYKPPMPKCSKDLEEVVKTFIPVTMESCDDPDKEIQYAWSYLWGRGLFDIVDNIYKSNTIRQYFYCKEGQFSGRVIIPFWRNGKIVFFQGRSLNRNHKPKYLTPSTEYGIKCSDVLYPFDVTQKTVVVCEGPIDAISLQLAGVNATATMGSSISKTQMKTLAGWGGEIICGYDNDAAGLRGMRKMDHMRKMAMLPPMKYVFPKGYKDWNEMYCQGIDCKEFIEKNSKLYSDLEFDVEVWSKS